MVRDEPATALPLIVLRWRTESPRCAGRAAILVLLLALLTLLSPLLKFLPRNIARLCAHFIIGLRSAADDEGLPLRLYTFLRLVSFGYLLLGLLLFMYGSLSHPSILLLSSPTSSFGCLGCTRPSGARQRSTCGRRRDPEIIGVCEQGGRGGRRGGGGGGGSGQG